MRMTGVRRLVEEALASLPKPYTEDVIDDVFHAIENNPEWRRQYDDLVFGLGKKVVNARGGFWIATAVGRSGVDQVVAKKSTLIDSYSKLTKTATKRGKKLKEPEALKTMSDYFQAHRAELPSSIVSHRDVIVEILMAGYTAEEAFSKAESPGA
ncbi:MAG TPA: hypothetical protein VIQ62_06970 [Burkholderiales bacterium]|jgi:hypothetical protein